MLLGFFQVIFLKEDFFLKPLAIRAAIFLDGKFPTTAIKLAR